MVTSKYFSLDCAHVTASSWDCPWGWLMLWSSPFPRAESFHIGEVWENGKAGKEIRNIMSREDQYSFCKDHFSLRRLGFSEAAILKHLPHRTLSRVLPEPTGWCVASGSQLSGSYLSQLTLKITHLQSLGFCAFLYLSCTHSFILTPEKLLTIHMVILENRRIRLFVCPMKTLSLQD